ncbi:hypothetical protein Fcan01_17860 [Folsomia candida]|uniref:Uncharacterized protein n=1 Tax=Folsomia candida TaxID=158441 RepID=A0A226DSU3_FOLCA|nr:hypothetical protein Fcan01_17860 [Folsomia candida]
MAEIIQYQDILTHCRSHLIPLSAIGPDELKSDVEKLLPDLQKNDFTLAIRPQDILSMYNYPLAKCYIAGDEITIHVKVPLHREGAKLTLYEVINLPYLYKDSVCTINHSPTYVVDADSYITTIQGTQLNSCDPSSGICYVSQFQSDPQIGKLCIESIIRGSSVNELKKACPFTCFPRLSQQPYITQLDFHTFMITSVPKGSTIVCDSANSTKIIRQLPEIEYGSLEVVIPCSCRLNIKGRSQPISSPYPCPTGNVDKISVVQTIPSTWAKIDVIVTDTMLRAGAKPITNTFANLSAALNESWVLESTTFNVSEIADLVHVKIPDIIHLLPSVSSALLYIWNVPLTLAILYLFWDRIKKAARLAASFTPKEWP